MEAESYKYSKNKKSNIPNTNPLMRSITGGDDFFDEELLDKENIRKATDLKKDITKTEELLEQNKECFEVG